MRKFRKNAQYIAKKFALAWGDFLGNAKKKD